MQVTKLGDHGFTLVELMTAVLVIGVLVTVAAPVYGQATAAAQMKGCQANQRTVSGAVDMYLSTGGAPGSGTAGQLTSGGSGWYDILVPGWIRSKPKCSLGQTDYLLDAAGRVVGDNGATAGFKAGHTAP